MDYYYLPYNPKQNVSRYMQFDDECCLEDINTESPQVPINKNWEAMHDFLYNFEEEKKMNLYNLLWKYKSYEDG